MPIRRTSRYETYPSIITPIRHPLHQPIILPPQLDPSCVLCLLPLRDNKWFDYSGHGNHGTNHGATKTAKGRRGFAWELDGLDDFFEHGTALVLPASFTITAWIKPTSTTGRFAGIVTKRGGSGGYFQLALDTNSKVYIYIYDLVTVKTALFDINMGQWYFIVAVLDRGSNLLKLSIDGGQSFDSADTTGLGVVGSNSAPLRIGYEEANDSYFKGIINDVLIFNRALAADEIKTLYEQGR